jgi:hypothetical protein
MMLEHPAGHPNHSLDQHYEVLVGHARLRVAGGSPAEAIDRARQKLCLELPRLWDLIQRLEREAFRVRLL